MAIRIGLIGKTNTGKTTFYNSATLGQGEISNYPFTTKMPAVGTAYVISPCVCREMKVKDNPVNSKCIDGWRYVPIELVDLPGLIKGASEGKGLGNQFLSVASQSDALIHVVDASGSIDEDGRIADPGTGDPLKDFEEIEGELVAWYVKIMENNRDKVLKLLKSSEPAEALAEPLRGMKIKPSEVAATLSRLNLNGEEFDSWTAGQLWDFAGTLREISKPTIIVANKMDLPGAMKNYKKLRDSHPDLIVVPASAEAELALRKAEQNNLIRYNPGDESFEILNEKALSQAQRNALQLIQRMVLKEFMRTGVQFALNVTVFKLLKMNVVYPVQDVDRLSDKHNNVLPDAHLLPSVQQFLTWHSLYTQTWQKIAICDRCRTKLRLPMIMCLR
jgi:GTP-binding conserved hypothetical protein TIGR00650